MASTAVAALAILSGCHGRFVSRDGQDGEDFLDHSDTAFLRIRVEWDEHPRPPRNDLGETSGGFETGHERGGRVLDLDPVARADAAQLQYPVFLVMDEFRTLGKLEKVTSAITTIRGYGDRSARRHKKHHRR